MNKKMKAVCSFPHVDGTGATTYKMQTPKGARMRRGKERWLLVPEYKKDKSYG